MVFEPKQWKYSNEVEKESIPVEAGIRHLLITDARLTDDETYIVEFEDLENEAVFSLRYWLNSIDDNGNIKPSAKDRGTLISLGKALAGRSIGIPYPDDIIGGVVEAEIFLKPNKAGDRFFPRAYKFNPVNSDLACLGTLDQYTIDAEGN